MLPIIAQVLSLITAWLFPISIFAVIAGVVVDLLKKRFYWSKFALIFFVITVILLVIQIKLIYRITGDISNNSSNEDVSTKATPTTNWKTYTNKDGGYTVKYPSTSENLDTTYVLLFNNLQPNFISFTEFNEKNTLKYFKYGQFTLPYEQPSITVLRANGKNLQEALDYFEQATQLNINKTESLKVNNIEAILFTTLVNVRRNINPLLLTNILAVHDDKIYIFSYAPDSAGRVKMISDQILSTFKFLDTSPSPTCWPRPACLDAEPRCLIAETADMCPPAEGKFCGGIANIECANGYACQLDDSYPDAGGKCVKE